MQNEWFRDRCECCGYVTKVKWFNSHYTRAKLCELCASTLAGNMMLNPPSMYPPNADILKTVCYIGNKILDELRRGKQNERN